MIRGLFIWLFFVSLTTFSCTDNSKSFVENSNLEKPKIKLSEGVESHIFFNKDFEEKSLLLIIKESDTLYSQIGYYYEFLKTNVFKKQESYFIRFNHYDNYFNENIDDEIKMYSFYEIDANKNKLIPVKSIREDQVLNAFKKQYNISNPLKVIVEERKIAYKKNGNVFLGNVVFIDTLKGEVCPSNAIFSIKDSINGIGFYPVKKKPFYIQDKLFLTDNNIVSMSFVSSSSNKENSFKIYAKTYSSYDRYYNPKNVNKYEIVVLTNDSLEEVLKTINKEDLFSLNSKKEKELNAGVISEFRPDLFKYKGEYFITIFLPNSDEYSESFPPIYNLDTLQRKLTPVLPLRIEKVKDYDGLNKLKTIELLSGDSKKRVSLFLNNFEIVRVDNEFKLIKTKQ